MPEITPENPIQPSQQLPEAPKASSWEIIADPKNPSKEFLILYADSKPAVKMELTQNNLMDLMDSLNDRLFIIGATDVDAWYLRNANVEGLQGVLSFSSDHAIVGSLPLDEETLKQLVPALLKYYDPHVTWSKKFWGWVMTHKTSAGILFGLLVSLITVAFIFRGGN